MGKKRSVIIGSVDESDDKAKRSRQLEQKKLREGKSAKAPGMGGGQRVVDTTTESLAEYDQLQAKLAAVSTPESEKSPEAKKTAKKTRRRSKSYQAAKSAVPVDHFFSLSEGIELLRKVSLSKFDPTVELHLVLKRIPDSKLSVALPHAFGKAKIIAIADDATISKIEAGHIDFDVLVASPAQMGKLVKFAKVLGPRGLMPNPKSGTVNADPDSAAKKLSADTSVVLKPDKGSPVIHTVVGKLSFKDKQLSDNITALLSVVSPIGIKKIVLKSTMSPAIKLVL